MSEGGDRDGFHIYTSSCDFLYNEDLDWAYHYFGFDKEYTEVIFLNTHVIFLNTDIIFFVKTIFQNTDVNLFKNTDVIF